MRLCGATVGKRTLPAYTIAEAPMLGLHWAHFYPGPRAARAALWGGVHPVMIAACQSTFGTPLLAMLFQVLVETGLVFGLLELGISGKRGGIMERQAMPLPCNPSYWNRQSHRGMSQVPT